MKGGEGRRREAKGGEGRRREAQEAKERKGREERDLISSTFVLCCFLFHSSISLSFIGTWGSNLICLLFIFLHFEIFREFADYNLKYFIGLERREGSWQDIHYSRQPQYVSYSH